MRVEYTVAKEKALSLATDQNASKKEKAQAMRRVQFYVRMERENLLPRWDNVPLATEEEIRAAMMVPLNLRAKAARIAFRARRTDTLHRTFDRYEVFHNTVLCFPSLLLSIPTVALNLLVA